jgi:hypothetical protein
MAAMSKMDDASGPQSGEIRRNDICLEILFAFAAFFALMLVILLLMCNVNVQSNGSMHSSFCSSAFCGSLDNGDSLSEAVARVQNRTGKIAELCTIWKKKLEFDLAYEYLKRESDMSEKLKKQKKNSVPPKKPSQPPKVDKPLKDKGKKKIMKEMLEEKSNVERTGLFVNSGMKTKLEPMPRGNFEETKYEGEYNAAAFVECVADPYNAQEVRLPDGTNLPTACMKTQQELQLAVHQATDGNFYAGVLVQPTVFNQVFIPDDTPDPAVASSFPWELNSNNAQYTWLAANAEVLRVVAMELRVWSETALLDRGGRYYLGAMPMADEAGVLPDWDSSISQLSNYFEAGDFVNIGKFLSIKWIPDVCVKSLRLWHGEQACDGATFHEPAFPYASESVLYDCPIIFVWQGGADDVAVATEMRASITTHIEYVPILAVSPLVDAQIANGDNDTAAAMMATAVRQRDRAGIGSSLKKAAGNLFKSVGKEAVKYGKKVLKKGAQFLLKKAPAFLAGLLARPRFTYEHLLSPEMNQLAFSHYVAMLEFWKLRHDKSKPEIDYKLVEDTKFKRPVDFAQRVAQCQKLGFPRIGHRRFFFDGRDYGIVIAWFRRIPPIDSSSPMCLEMKEGKADLVGDLWYPCAYPAIPINLGCIVPGMGISIRKLRYVDYSYHNQSHVYDSPYLKYTEASEVLSIE